MNRAALILPALGAALLLLVIGSVIYSRTHPAQRRPPSPAQQHFEQGLHLAQQGDIATAMYQWNTAIGLDPTFTPAYLAIARQDEQHGDLVGATGILERLHAANPGTPQIESRLAMIYFQAGRYEKGMALDRQAVQHEQGDPLAHAALGKGLALAGEMKQGAAELRTAHQLAPDDEPILLDLADSLGQAGAAAEALSLVRPNLARARNPARFNLVMGELLQQQSSREAETYLRKSLSLAPDQAATQSALGSLLLRTGRAAEAQPLLERAYRRNPADLAALQDLATVYTRLKRPAAAQARQAAQKLASYHEALVHARNRYLNQPDDGRNALTLARLEAQRGNLSDAVDLVMQILHTNPNDAAALRLLHQLNGH